MKLTTAQAAAAAGVSRTTIWRAVKAGKVSAERTGDRDFLIDAAELARAFPDMKPLEQLQSVPMEPRATELVSDGTSVLQAELEAARQRIASLEADKDDLRGERDRLLKVIEEQAGTMRLLTDQRTVKQDSVAESVQVERRETSIFQDQAPTVLQSVRAWVARRLGS
jgi:excisionase family DNA binding protein